MDASDSTSTSTSGCMTVGEVVEETDHLGAFLRFADAVQANTERAHRPAYAETCGCGGSVEVGRDVSRADLRRIHANFLGRHRECLAEVTTPPGEASGR